MDLALMAAPNTDTGNTNRKKFGFKVVLRENVV